MKFHSQQKVSARGYYSINVLDSEGNDTGKTVKDIPNVVTITGKSLTRHDGGDNVSSEPVMAGILGFAAGTGTTERTVSSTTLGNEVAIGKGTVSNGEGTGYTDNLDGTETYKRVCIGSYPLGDLDATISEVGIFYGNTLAAGQLIKDGNGDPTTITVLSDEQLVVTYTIEWTYTFDVLGETTGTIDVNGVTTTWTLKVSPIKTGPVFKYPTRDYNKLPMFYEYTVLLAADDTPLLEKNIDVNTAQNISGGSKYTLGGSWAPSEVTGDITAIVFNGSDSGVYDPLDNFCSARIEFSPAIPKTSSDVLTVEVSWDVVGT